MSPIRVPGVVEPSVGLFGDAKEIDGKRRWKVVSKLEPDIVPK